MHENLLLILGLLFVVMLLVMLAQKDPYRLSDLFSAGRLGHRFYSGHPAAETRSRTDLPGFPAALAVRSGLVYVLERI